MSTAAISGNGKGGIFSKLSLFAAAAALFGRTKQMITSLPKEARPSRRKGKLAGHSRAPLRKNGVREMARRVRQMANGTHGL